MINRDQGPPCFLVDDVVSRIRRQGVAVWADLRLTVVVDIDPVEKRSHVPCFSNVSQEFCVAIVRTWRRKPSHIVVSGDNQNPVRRRAEIPEPRQESLKRLKTIFVICDRDVAADDNGRERALALDVLQLFERPAKDLVPVRSVGYWDEFVLIVARNLVKRSAAEVKIR